MPVNSDELRILSPKPSIILILKFTQTSASGISSVDLSPPFAKMSGLSFSRDLHTVLSLSMDMSKISCFEQWIWAKFLSLINGYEQNLFLLIWAKFLSLINGKRNLKNYPSTYICLSHSQTGCMFPWILNYIRQR